VLLSARVLCLRDTATSTKVSRALCHLSLSNLLDEEQQTSAWHPKDEPLNGTARQSIAGTITFDTAILAITATSRDQQVSKPYL
jgi:hypothetical protein